MILGQVVTLLAVSFVGSLIAGFNIRSISAGRYVSSFIGHFILALFGATSIAIIAQNADDLLLRLMYATAASTGLVFGIFIHKRIYRIYGYGQKPGNHKAVKE